MLFVQVIPTFFGIIRTQFDTAVLSSSYEEEGLPDQVCSHYCIWIFSSEHRSSIHADLHSGLCRFQSENT